MLMIQLTGLSGAGKSTISTEIKILLQLSGIPVEIIDGDHRALLADDDPNKLFNLTGVNDHYDIPTAPDLRLQTHLNSLQECTLRLFDFIMRHLKSDDGSPVAQLSDAFQYHA